MRRWFSSSYLHKLPGLLYPPFLSLPSLKKEHKREALLINTVDNLLLCVLVLPISRIDGIHIDMIEGGCREFAVQEDRSAGQSY